MKILTKILLAVICVMMSFSAISAQTKEESEAKRKAEMKKLDILVGTWKGTGWVMSQKGRQTSSITETFQYKLGGQIAVVDGLGISKDEKTGEERITHQAYGIFTYDTESGKLKFRYYKAETGEEGETLIQIVDKSLTWGFDVNETGSKVKFTMRINEKGNWHETGEFSRDAGKTWMKFMEMELSKVLDGNSKNTLSSTPQPKYFVFNYFPDTNWVNGKPITEQPLSKHFAYMKKLATEGILVLGGPFKDNSGAFGIIEASDLETANRIIYQDPAVIEKVVRVEVREWSSAVVGCVEKSK
jgi:uncharacterized protein YciI